MQIRDFAFSNPHGTWLLIMVIPLILMGLYLNYYRAKTLSSFADPSLLQTLLSGRSRWMTRVKLIAWSLVWIFGCLALMNPIGNLRYRQISSGQPLEEKSNEPRYKPHEVIFLVDTSLSMSIPDGPTGETRLDQAKDIMENSLRQLRGPTISLDSLTSVLTPLVPPTLDYLFVRLIIKNLHYNEGDVGGTLYQTVLTELVKKSLSQTSQKMYSLVILSDGGDTQIEGLKGEAQQKAIDTIADIMTHAQIPHLRIFTVGIGSNQPSVIPNVTYEGKPVKSALEPKILELLAEKNRGTYFEAQADSVWNLSRELVEKINQDPPIELNSTYPSRRMMAAHAEDLIYDLYFQIPLGIALMILLMNFLLPDVKR